MYRRGRKKRKRERTTRGIKTRNKKRKNKAKEAKRSGRVFRDGLFGGVGRERASRCRRSWTGCLSLIKISRNSSTLAKIRRCFPPLLTHRFCRAEFLIFNYSPVLLISRAWPLGRDCRRVVIVRANKFVVSGRWKHLLNIDLPSRERSIYYTICPITQLLNFVNFRNDGEG